jgi:hypothetical protein
MPELFQIFKSHSGFGKKGGSMDLVHLSGGLLVKKLFSYQFICSKSPLWG